MLTRKSFLKTTVLAAAAADFPASGENPPESFREALLREMDSALRRHRDDPDTETTNLVVAAEVSDGIHVRALSEGIPYVAVGCDVEDGIRVVVASYRKDGRTFLVRREDPK